MTHADLVKISVKMAHKLGFPLAITELKASSTKGEIPDCLAFKGGGDTLLIECKTSRADFLRDKEKKFKSKSLGMGDYRLFLFCESVNISHNEIPKDWEYIKVNESGEVTESSIRITNLGLIDSLQFKKNAKAEVAVLYSYIRRSKI